MRLATVITPELKVVLESGPDALETVRRASEGKGRELAESEFGPAAPRRAGSCVWA